MSFLTRWLLGIFIFCSLGVAEAAQVVNLKDLESQVRNRNTAVAAAQSKVEASRARTGSFGRSFLPELQAQISEESFLLGRQDRITQTGWKLEAGLNIFRGGADFLEEQYLKKQELQQNSEAELVFRNELANVYELYWALVYKQEALEAYKAHLDLMKKNLREADRRIQAGVATATDRLEFEMKMSLIKQEIALAEKDLRFLSKKLALLLGMDGEVVPGELRTHNHDWEKELQRLAVEARPELKILSAEQGALEAKKSLYRGHYLPSVDVYAGLSEPNQREGENLPDVADRKESYVGVRASWSLGKAIAGGVERKALARKLQGKDLERQRLEKLLSLQQDQQFDELKTLHSFVHDSEENIKLSQRYMEVTLKEYGRGVKNSLDVLEAAEKYIGARLRLWEIIRDFNILYSQQRALLAPY